MSVFGKRSTKNLEECHKDLQTIFNEVIKYFDCSIIAGHRSQQDQDIAYAKGLSKVKYPNSKHNKIPSMAVDAVPYYKDSPHIRWNDSSRMDYFAGYVMGIASLLKNRGIIDHALRWGNDWDMDTRTDDTNFVDRPHFELRVC